MIYLPHLVVALYLLGVLPFAMVAHSVGSVIPTLIHGAIPLKRLAYFTKKNSHFLALFWPVTTLVFHIMVVAAVAVYVIETKDRDDKT